MKHASLFSAAALAAVLVLPQQASAQVEPYLGQLIPVGFDFCPRGWLEANGQSLPNSHPLYALYGVIYGADTAGTFKLPDLRGRTPVHVGNPAGLPPLRQGEMVGKTSINLTLDQMPAHRHDLQATDGGPNSGDPTGAAFATFTSPVFNKDRAPQKLMKANSIGLAGKGAAIDIRAPSLGLRWCVSMAGIFPTRP